jgi:S-formylglutathione hydrolase FrmB
MGGHGALTLYLSSKSKQYRSASAFAPICNPTKCPWGEKAFRGYLKGGLEEASGKYDATDLIASYKDPVHILIDYVRVLLPIHNPESSYNQRFSRVPETTFTSRTNYFLRTS